MRRAHFIVGLLALVAFLATGQYMRHGLGGMEAQPDGTRMLLRSAHGYLLLAGLLNLCLGLYLQPTVGWRNKVQTLGSVALLIAPGVLLSAFMLEPWRGDLERPWAAPALQATLAGTLAHVASQVRRRPKPD